jgi:hypothetical protein
MGIIYVLIGAFCFAISNAYWKKVTATIPYQIGMFYRGIFATIIFSILYFGFRQADFFKYWIVRDIVMDKEFILSIALSIFNIFGLVFFLQGIQKAPISVVVPVSSLKIFTIITAVFIMGEVWYSYCILKEQRYKIQKHLKKASYMVLHPAFFGAVLLHCINFQLHGGVHLVLV